MNNSTFIRHTFEVNGDIRQRDTRTLPSKKQVATDQWNLKPKKALKCFFNLNPYLPRNQHLIDCFPVFQHHPQVFKIGLQDRSATLESNLFCIFEFLYFLFLHFCIFAFLHFCIFVFITSSYSFQDRFAGSVGNTWVKPDK